MSIRRPWDKPTSQSNPVLETWTLAGIPKVMGAEGDPPLALRRSIDKGMAPNSGGRHVNYLEIYAADVAPAAMQPVLQYAAQLFTAGSH